MAKYSKENPKNKMHAWVFQIRDDLKYMESMALYENREEFNKQADVIIEKIKQAKLKK